MNEAELIFTSLLRCDRAVLYLQRDRRLSRKNTCFLAEALKKRVMGVPLEYILGTTECMGLEFKVDAHVFIPRPETEIVIEEALRCAASLSSKKKSVRILDLGTGAGTIAISLAHRLPQATFYAVDISEKALARAQANADLHGLKERIMFLHGDLFSNPALNGRTYDIIVSNPPYIARGEIPYLQPEVRCQPLIALDGGPDGLDFYRRIAADAPRFLTADGLIIAEIGSSQRSAVVEIFQAEGAFELRKVTRDYGGIERVVVVGSRPQVPA